MASDPNLRARLIEVIRSASPTFSDDLSDDTELIESGRLDSLALFNVATFVEQELGEPLDLGSFDLSREWNTLGGILAHLRARKAGR